MRERERELEREREREGEGEIERERERERERPVTLRESASSKGYCRLEPIHLRVGLDKSCSGKDVKRPIL